MHKDPRSRPVHDPQASEKVLISLLRKYTQLDLRLDQTPQLQVSDLSYPP